MSETLPSSTTPEATEAPVPSTAELDLIVNGPAETNAEADIDTREVSPAAGLLHRVANFFEQRAINKAHKEAFREYRNRDNDSYTDTISAMASTEDAPYQEYGQKLLNREHRREDRQEMMDKAVAFSRSIGAAALETTKNAGLITLGLGLVAGEQIGKGARAAGRSINEGIQTATENVQNAVEFGTQGYYDTVEGVKDTLRDARDTLTDKVTETRDTIVEKAVNMRDSVKERLMSLRDAAKARRDARRAKWTARKENAKQWIDDRKEEALYMGGLAKDSVIETATTARDKASEFATSARDKADEFIAENQKRAEALKAARTAAAEAAISTYQNLREDQKTHN